MEHQWRLEGTSRLNTTGGSGTLTVPKNVAQWLLENHGQDYAVFVEDNKLMFKPKAEVEA